MTDLQKPLKICNFYTPKPLAQAMVQALGDRPEDLWLEPCFGEGVFLERLSKLRVSRERIYAVDIDEPSKSLDSLGQTFRGQDFLKWSMETQLRFDKIIGNPPYIGLSKLPQSLQCSALRLVDPVGHPIPLGSNCWYAFLCASLDLLRPRGSLSFVLPAAWDYADYAASLRNSVGRLFGRFEVHRCLRPLFNDAQDGCVVIVGRDFGAKKNLELRFEHETSEALINTLCKTNHELKPKFDSKSECLQALPNPTESDLAIRDILELRLGGVTGDAKYFLMTEDERQQYELPTSALKPVLTKASHLMSDRITKSIWNSLRDRGERIWLFYPPDKLLEHPRVRSYLNLSEDEGGCRRKNYKIKNRSPWYHTPIPDRIDGFISGMSSFGPWISLRSMKGLAATNTLYTVHFKGRLSLDTKSAWCISLLSSYSRAYVNILGRRYPDGLLKYEPGDLLDIRIRTPKKITGAHRRYSEIIKMLQGGDSQGSYSLADQWMNEREP